MNYLIGLLIATIITSMAINYVTYNELTYYKSTTYDASRFAEVRPLVQDKILEMTNTVDFDVVYISLFHNGLRWENDEFHPPSVNEVFFWSRNPSKPGNNFAERLAVYQDVPLGSVNRIEETLLGKCIGIKTDIMYEDNTVNEFSVDFRCPLLNQRGEVVGYFGGISTNPSDKNIADYVNILSLYQVVFSELLFKK